MNILGISAFYHDSAAALVVDGVISAAAQEERFTRFKQDSGFPAHAVNYCLDSANISPAELDYVVFYDKPLLKFERLIETYLHFAPRGFNSFSRAMPLWLKQKLFIRKEIKKRMGKDFRGRIVFTEHHESHAGSAFFPSPFDEAAVLTVDGVGEWATASIAHGSGNQLRMLREMRFPHSLGLLYSAFTYYTGFKVNSGEYKLMGLAPYGKPIYADIIREKIVKIGNDGSIMMDQRYFDYCCGLTMTSSRFHDLFGAPPRPPESRIRRLDMDLAASIQAITEEIMLKMASHARELTGCTRLCLAGGVALNCVANGKLLRSGIFEDIWIQPASGDAGGALGAALFLWYQLLGNPRCSDNHNDWQQGSFLGPEFDTDAIDAFLKTQELRSHFFEQEDVLLEEVARGLERQQVIGWFQGRMEFGPRALGNRSILGDPRNTEMQSKMNLKIKYRESFRPFAPAVAAEDAAAYFELDGQSPYMLLVADVRRERRLESGEDAGDNADDLIRQVNRVRSDIPAVTHVDYSARVQTVAENGNRRFYRLLRRFKELTGCPMVINTSFNIRGEPIVCTPADAFRCFMNTDMDMLVLGNHILYKNEQDAKAAGDVEKYKQSFKLD